MRAYAIKTPEDFWRRVVRADGCWEWSGARMPTGYGHLRYNGREWYAHRLAYALAIGAIPDGAFICHRCSHPPCCRPDHLYAGSARDNHADAVAASHATKPPMFFGSEHWAHVRPERIVKGERHGLAKVSADDVREMRRLYGQGGVSYRTLGGQYGMTAQAVCRIVKRRVWQHVD